jgi:hypothetical protein
MSPGFNGRLLAGRNVHHGSVYRFLEAKVRSCSICCLLKLDKALLVNWIGPPMVFSNDCVKYLLYKSFKNKILWDLPFKWFAIYKCHTPLSSSPVCSPLETTQRLVQILLVAYSSTRLLTLFLQTVRWVRYTSFVSNWIVHTRTCW